MYVPRINNLTSNFISLFLSSERAFIVCLQTEPTYAPEFQNVESNTEETNNPLSCHFKAFNVFINSQYSSETF